jgi:two-component system, NarL family, sensor histidine kinase UhpB
MNGATGIVFFIYGLAFFSMGLALLMESQRPPLLAERRVLLSLALFGLVHGFHEWFELYIYRGGETAAIFGLEFSGVRVVFLVVSFSLLLYFAVFTFWPDKKDQNRNLIILSVFLVFYFLVVWLDAAYGVHQSGEGLSHADVFSRYFLGMPGAALACLALLQQARLSRKIGSSHLYRALQAAAIGFGLYSLTQFFVSPHVFFPANVFNTLSFIEIVGFPVQVVRAGAAIEITICMLLAVQAGDQVRRAQFDSAQKGRLEAVERLQQELIQREALRIKLMRKIVLAQEEERARIARELHDETAQLLTAFSLHLAALSQSKADSPAFDKNIAELKNINRQIADGLYRLVHELRPAQLDDLGLIPALKFLLDETQMRTNLATKLVVNGDCKRLDELVETVIFRVTQEALSNVIRHAGVKLAQVEISFTSQLVRLEIRDEGKGFQIQTVYDSPRGLGLAGMRERVEAVGGNFKVSSEIGSGTSVLAEIPVLGRSAATIPEISVVETSKPLETEALL